ncbi:MAG: hypothetical protein HQ505_00375 [Nitrosopumilus sp.]|nr:hypothetical protein [Nitrosopumilus sp.]
MKSKKISFQAFEKKKYFHLKNRRGVADIISTMLLMAITVTGASTLTYFMNDAFISGNLATVNTLDSSSLNLLLLAYDTRDSSSLLTLIDVDNNISGELCGSGCIASPTNSLPENLGTEFIVLQIQNNGLNPIFLEDVAINNVVHTWDSETALIPLDASVDYLTGTSRPYPSDGTFSILPVSSGQIIQNNSNEIQNGQKVNILIKLSADNSDIRLNQGIHVFFDIGAPHTVNFLIDSGDAR